MIKATTFLACLIALAFVQPVSALEGATGAHTQAYGYVIPFQYDPPLQSKIVIRLRINGQGPFPFVYDTGMNGTLLIHEPIAKKLGLKVTGEKASTVPEGFVTRETTIDEASIDSDTVPVVMKAFGAGVGDIGPLLQNARRADVAGIVGTALFGRLKVRLDFARKEMALFLGDAPKPAAPGATTVPMREEDGRYRVTVSPAPGVTTEQVIDTGAEGTSVPSKIINRLHPAAVAYSGYMSIDGAIHTSSNMLLPEFWIGTVTLRNVAVSSEPTQSLVSLGVDVLSRFRVTFDFPALKLTLEPREAPNDTGPQDGWTGIKVSSQGDTVMTDRVQAGSPAAVAGMLAGDQILSIDGHALRGLDTETVWTLLNGLAGTPAELVIQRAGVQQNIRFRRKSVFDAPSGALDGLEMVRPPNATLRILNLLPASTGAKAGLRAGDEIVSLDGQEVANLTVEQLRPFFSGDKVKVAIRRPGQAKLVEATLSVK